MTKTKAEKEHEAAAKVVESALADMQKHEDAGPPADVDEEVRWQLKKQVLARRMRAAQAALQPLREAHEAEIAEGERKANEGKVLLARVLHSVRVFTTGTGGSDLRYAIDQMQAAGVADKAVLDAVGRLRDAVADLEKLAA